MTDQAPVRLNQYTRLSREPLSTRLLTLSMPVTECGCWVWLAGCDSGGYGSLCYARKRDRAHRLSWRVFRGEIPHGMYVLHTCDNRLCINPDHLFLGTHIDNQADKNRKGRNVAPRLLGEINPMAKLSVKDVLFVRSSDMTNADMARFLNVSFGTIHLIRKNKTWRHI